MKLKALPILLALAAIQFVLFSCTFYSFPAPDLLTTEKLPVSNSTGSAKFVDMSPIGTFVGRLCRWKNEPCFIATSKIYRLNLNELTAQPITLPEQLNPVTHLEMSQDNRLIGISNKKEGATFFIESKDKWKQLPLPLRIDGHSRKTEKLAVNGDKAFVIYDGSAFLWDGKAWLDKSFPKDKNIFRNPTKVLIGDDYIYFACDRGEFGGGLGRLGIKSDIFEEISGIPVIDMALDKAGKLWFFERCLDEGSLNTLEGDTPKIQCGVTMYLRTKKLSPSGRMEGVPVNWPFSPDVFCSMSVCDNGSILMSTLQQGIFKYKEGKITRLTPDWNYRTHISSVLPLENDNVCFSVSDKGVAVVRNRRKIVKDSDNTPSQFLNTFKSLLINADSAGEELTRKAEQNEEAGKLAQAAAEYLLSSARAANRGNYPKSDERIVSCERILNEMPGDFNPAYLDALTIASMDDVFIRENGGSYKYRITLCRKIQELLEKLNMVQDKRSVTILLKLLESARKDVSQNTSLSLVPILCELACVSLDLSDEINAKKYAEEAISIANKPEQWGITSDALRQNAFVALTHISEVGEGRLDQTEEKALLVALNMALTCDLSGTISFRKPLNKYIGFHKKKGTKRKMELVVNKIINDLRAENKVNISLEFESALQSSGLWKGSNSQYFAF